MVSFLVMIFVFSQDMAKDNLKVQDGDHSLGFIVGSIGIANTVSRFVLGYLSDKKWVNRLYLYSTSLTLCGIGKRNFISVVRRASVHFQWFSWK